MGCFVAGQYVEDWEDQWNITVSPARLLHELRGHDIGADSERETEFFETFGFRAAYDAQEVLHWLGY